MKEVKVIEDLQAQTDTCDTSVEEQYQAEQDQATGEAQHEAEGREQMEFEAQQEEDYHHYMNEQG